jgi:hypothetical protein
MNTPEVWMSASAYAAACAEFARWAAIGQRRSGAAWEAVVYPLVGIVSRPGAERSPLEATPLADCAALVVPRVVVPPPALAHYGPTWARPRLGAATAGAAAALTARLAAVRAAHPRLDCYGRMHSHPWPHQQPHPSGTDCREHLTGALESNAAAGLSWSLGLIAAAPDGGLGATDFGFSILDFGRRDQGSRSRDQEALGTLQNPKSKIQNPQWPIQAYALLAAGALVPLGAVRVAAEGDRRVRQVLAGAGWATAAGIRWRARQAARLAAQGRQVMALPLHRGWYGFVVRAAGATRLVALPPTFPLVPPRVLQFTPGGWVGTAVTPRAARWGAYDLADVLAESGWIA